MIPVICVPSGRVPGGILGLLHIPEIRITHAHQHSLILLHHLNQRLVAAVVRILDNFHLLLTSFTYVDEMETASYRFFRKKETEFQNHCTPDCLCCQHRKCPPGVGGHRKISLAIPDIGALHLYLIEFHQAIGVIEIHAEAIAHKLRVAGDVQQP